MSNVFFQTYLFLINFFYDIIHWIVVCFSPSCKCVLCLLLIPSQYLVIYSYSLYLFFNNLMFSIHSAFIFFSLNLPKPTNNLFVFQFFIIFLKFSIYIFNKFFLFHIFSISCEFLLVLFSIPYNKSTNMFFFVIVISYSCFLEYNQQKILWTAILKSIYIYRYIRLLTNVLEWQDSNTNSIHVTVKCEDVLPIARYIGVVPGSIHTLRTRARIRRSVASSLPLCDRNGIKSS